MYTLLLVDDDLAILEMLTLALDRPGVHLLTARTVTQAMNVINHHRVDAAVLDVHLTTANGREGLTVLRLLRLAQPGAESIVLTGSSEPHLRRRAYRAGAWSFMRKPVELPELLGQLTQLGFPSTRWSRQGPDRINARPGLPFTHKSSFSESPSGHMQGARLPI